MVRGSGAGDRGSVVSTGSPAYFTVLNMHQNFGQFHICREILLSIF